MNKKTNAPLIADLEGLYLTASDRDFLRHPKLGGVILFSRNYESPQQLRELVSSVRQECQDLLICVDQEGGRVQRFREGFSRLPAMRRIGERFDMNPEQGVDESMQLGALMAYELLELDIDLSFAPVLDLFDMDSKVIADRAFSSNPDSTETLARAFIQGMRSMGMNACAKHFPGHGGVIADSHMELPIDMRGLDEIRARDMRPFAALYAEVSAIMTAHIQFPEICDQPVSFSERWINQYLRADIGFDGIVFSDDLSMKGAAGVESFSDRAMIALKAGCDAVLICNNRPEAEKALDELESAQITTTRSLCSLRHTYTGLGPDEQATIERAKSTLVHYYNI